MEFIVLVITSLVVTDCKGRFGIERFTVRCGEYDRFWFIWMFLNWIKVLLVIFIYGMVIFNFLKSLLVYTIIKGLFHFIFILVLNIRFHFHLDLPQLPKPILILMNFHFHTMYFFLNNEFIFLQFILILIIII